MTVCTRRGNHSWNGLVKRIDPLRCERLFVHVGDGRRWYIPLLRWEEAGESVSAPSYAEFDVEPGQPLQARLPPTAGAAS